MEARRTYEYGKGFLLAPEDDEDVYRFGKRVRNQVRRHEYEVHDYLRDWQTSYRDYGFDAKPCLDGTKFSKGFKRRSKEAMIAMSDQELEKAEGFRKEKHQRSLQNLHARKALLSSKATTVPGYDIITGNQKPGAQFELKDGKDRKMEPSYSQGRKHFIVTNSGFDRIGPDPRSMEGRSLITFSQRTVTSNVFHDAHQKPESASSRNRTQRLANDGLDPSKKTSMILRSGREELASRGAADNFSNSYWLEQAKAKQSKKV